MLYLMVSGPLHGIWKDFEFEPLPGTPDARKVSLLSRMPGFPREPYGADFVVSTYRFERLMFDPDTYLDVLVHDVFHVGLRPIMMDALYAACDPRYQPRWRLT